MRSLLRGSYALIGLLFVGFLLFGQPEISAEASSGASLFEGARAMDHLQRLERLSEASGRRAGSPGNARARAYMERYFEQLGLKAYQQAFHDPLGGNMANVIATVPGTRDEAIIVCAHHDAEREGPAAVQGTSGLAVLLELARATSVQAAEQRRRGSGRSRAVVFASWDGESYGCAGSTHFIETLPASERAKLRAVVSLDAIGWKGGRAVVHVLPYYDRFGARSVAPDWLATRVTNAARARGGELPLGDPWLGLFYQVMVRAVDVGYYSDDRPFLEKGVPALFVSDFSLMHAYPNARKTADTIDQVGAAQIASLGCSLEAVLTDLASADWLPAGEKDYLVLRPFFVRSLRLTADQAKVLAVLCLLPGALTLIRRRREGGLIVTRTLFFAFATIFLLGTFEDPILFPALFAAVLLASPLLSISRPPALWGHIASLLPCVLFTAVLAPVFITGAAALVTLSRFELAAAAGLMSLGLLQACLHSRRVLLAQPRPA